MLQLQVSDFSPCVDDCLKNICGKELAINITEQIWIFYIL